MPLALITVSDVAVILNADEITTAFGLELGEIPILTGGAFTPGANSAILDISYNGDADTTDSVVEIEAKKSFRVSGAIGLKNMHIVGAQASGLSVPVTPFEPTPLTRQLAMITDNAASSFVTFTFFKAEGNLVRREEPERLADRRRMHFAPPAGVPGFIMNAGLRNRMGDVPGGF